MNEINKPTDAIKHPANKRAAIPTSELAGEESAVIASQEKTAAYQTFKNEFERGKDPELYWLGKYKNDDEQTQSTDLKVDIRSLYVHEDIQPETLIDRLYRTKEDNNQPNLFGDELSNPIDDELERVAEYYRHNSDWKNRLIQGDSLLVMNSLIKREGMSGKVQCVYMDPPYGIRYGGNWQIMINKPKMSHESKDAEISSEPEMIKAFRDTWELGIHSYLSYLRDRLVLAKELLTHTGSCFVQISDENVHLVRTVMDEVFGSENFVAQILYQKTTGAGSPNELTTVASVGDYILWYAKQKTVNKKINYKFRPLFVSKTFGGEGSSAYKKIELQNGDRMSISEWEKKNGRKYDYSNRPEGSRLYALDNLTSQSGGDIGRFDIEFMNKVFHVPGGNVWKTNEKGIERLKECRRLDVSSKGGLGYVRYFDDFPALPLNNIWTDTVGQNQMGGDKIYVVQSALKPIQRCILMATDPGDLVLDPTCGSGTTAYVSEMWGRRWITVDTSRIALNIAKIRLTKSVYPYFELFDKTDTSDIRQGFVYRTIPHLKLSNIANDEEPEKEILYDQPLINKKKLRVSGPFTVETLQSFNVVSPESLDARPDEAEENRLFQERIFSHLQTSGIRNGDKTQKAVFHGVETVANPILHAKGYYTDADGVERLVYFHIGPKFGTVSKRAVNEAVKIFRGSKLQEGASWLVLLGFSFEDNINDKDYNLGTFNVSKVRMHDDLMQDGLLKKDKGAGSFITIGEPDIAIVKDNDEFCHVEIRGLDIYDPIKDIVKPRSVEDIAYWEMDDKYDDTRFVLRSIHFCGGDKKEFDDWRKGLGTLFNASAKTKKNAQDTLRMEFSDEIWDTLYGFTSEPIPYEPGRKIAVRVISQFGEESSKVLTID
jgi:adenine-specific DNA-methyltransferase